MKEKIGLQDLSALLAEKAAITKKEAETFLREYFDVLNEELINSGLIKVKDLGTFKLSMMDSRESIDVTDGHRVLIPAHYKVIFTPDKKLAETVNEPFDLFETTEIDDEEPLLEEPVSMDEPILEEEEEELVPEDEPVLGEEEEELKEVEEVEESYEQRHCEDDSPKQSSEDQGFGLLHSVRNDEEDEPVSEEKPDEANNDYDEEYFKTRKKMKYLRLIVYILCLLLLGTLGYIIYLQQYVLDVLKFF